MSEELNGVSDYSCNNLISSSRLQSKTLKKEAPNHCQCDFDGASTLETIET